MAPSYLVGYGKISAGIYCHFLWKIVVFTAYVHSRLRTINLMHLSPLYSSIFELSMCFPFRVVYVVFCHISDVILTAVLERI